jgi:hypothetical protein
MFHRVLAALAIVDLPLGVNASQEHLAMPLDHPADAQAFHDVGADAKNFHERAALLSGGLSVLILAKNCSICKMVSPRSHRT